VLIWPIYMEITPG